MLCKIILNLTQGAENPQEEDVGSVRIQESRLKADENFIRHLLRIHFWLDWHIKIRIMITMLCDELILTQVRGAENPQEEYPGPVLALKL